MSRFYFQYAGNKRREAPRILEALVGAGPFSVVAEPFAGSAALSLEMAAELPGLRVSLNDGDARLVDFYREVARVGSQPFFDYVNARLTPEAYAAEQRAEGPYAYYYQRRVTRTFGRKGAPEEFKPYKRTARQAATDAVIAAAELSCGDWLAHANRFADDPAALVFLDPPYFASHNKDYAAFAGPSWNEEGRCADATQIYVDILRYMERARCTVVLVTNANAIMRHLYGRWSLGEYDHAYASVVRGRGAQAVPRKATHMICVKLSELWPAAHAGPAEAGAAGGPA